MERILVVDDEPLARRRLIQLVARVAPLAEVREAPDGDAAVDVIRAWRPEVVLLDVQMPGRDGFAVVDAVGASQMPPTVFVTAYDQHAVQAFEVAAVDYLLKPFDEARFDAMWSRVLERQAAAQRSAEAYAQRFLVKVGDKTTIVPVADVKWLRSDGNYVDLHTAAGVRTIRETLANVERQLDPRRFVRIHRRVIVAIDQIKAIQPWFGGDQLVILKDASTLRVSRTRREFVAARLGGIAG